MSGSERSEGRYGFSAKVTSALCVENVSPWQKQPTETEEVELGIFLFIRRAVFLSFTSSAWSSRFDRLYGPRKIHLADAIPSGVNEFLVQESIFKHYVISINQWDRDYKFKNTQRCTNHGHVDANIRSRYVSSQAPRARYRLVRIMSDSGDPDERDFQIPEEDTIVYRLYTLEKDESILGKLAADCNQHAQSIARNHIWHYDRFSLEVVCAGRKRGERGGNSHWE